MTPEQYERNTKKYRSFYFNKLCQFQVLSNKEVPPSDLEIMRRSCFDQLLQHNPKERCQIITCGWQYIHFRNLLKAIR